MVCGSNTMELTEHDKTFLKHLKDQGVGMDEAFKRLKDAKDHLLQQNQVQGNSIQFLEPVCLFYRNR